MAGVIFLHGCATTSDEDNKNLVRIYINSNQYSDKLRLVQPIDRKRDAALMVLGVFAGSIRTPTAKEDFKGEEVSTVLHPAGNAFKTAAMAIINKWGRIMPLPKNMRTH